MKFSNTERTWRLSNGMKNEARFLSFETLELSQAFFKFPVSGFGDENELISCTTICILFAF